LSTYLETFSENMHDLIKELSTCLSKRFDKYLNKDIFLIATFLAPTAGFDSIDTADRSKCLKLVRDNLLKIQDRFKFDSNRNRIKQQAYRTSKTQKEEIERQVDAMLEHGIIELSKGPWASPVVLIKKKNSNYRFCVDFRRLNKATKPDTYPIPIMEDTAESLHGSRLFTTLDLASGYWQVQLNEASKEKTALTCAAGLFQFVKMPFGLTNAPDTFQRLMDTVLTRLNWKQSIVYLDDIIIFSSNFQEHLERLRRVLERVSHARLKIKLEKCKFEQSQVNFLGFNMTAMTMKK
jgi:hypothetical protein